LSSLPAARIPARLEIKPTCGVVACQAFLLAAVCIHDPDVATSDGPPAAPNESDPLPIRGPGRWARVRVVKEPVSDNLGAAAVGAEDERLATHADDDSIAAGRPVEI
jgi:hypothetical protein